MEVGTMLYVILQVRGNAVLGVILLHWLTWTHPSYVSDVLALLYASFVYWPRACEEFPT